MKRIYFTFFLIYIGFTISTAQILDVGEIYQEKNQWCWAGVSKCVLDYYDIIIEQCDIVEYTRSVATWHNFGNTACCINPTLGCNYSNYMYDSEGSINDILETLGSISNYGQTSEISEEDIEFELRFGRPFIVGWAWPYGGGHVVVGHGKNDQTIYFMDPWPGEGFKFTDYDLLVENNEHKWIQTLLLKSKPKQIPVLPVCGIVPNPTTGKITITTTEEYIDYVEIKDMFGKTVFTSEVTSWRFDIDLSEQAQGLYIVRITKEKMPLDKEIHTINMKVIKL